MHQPRLPFRRPDPAPPALTLADLRREGLDLLCRCRLCRHTGILPIAMAIQHHGETATVPAVRGRYGWPVPTMM